MMCIYVCYSIESLQLPWEILCEEVDSKKNILSIITELALGTIEIGTQLDSKPLVPDKLNSQALLVIKTGLIIQR